MKITPFTQYESTVSERIKELTEGNLQYGRTSATCEINEEIEVNEIIIGLDGIVTAPITNREEENDVIEIGEMEFQGTVEMNDYDGILFQSPVFITI